MLDVRRMRVLREVAVRGSFSAAAEALSFTQSAISQQIAALERAVIFGGALAESYSIEGLELMELLEDPLYLVLPADHPLARKRNIRLADLAHEEWIGGPGACEGTARVPRP